MQSADGKVQIELFSTAPQSAHVDAGRFVPLTRDVARWSEEAGCRGILVYTDNRLVDPWLVAQLVIEATEQLAPLVAVQPAYMHPYSVATMISSLAFLHGRRVFLNMVAGGFKRDLEALGDATPHDERYARLVEYTSLVLALLDTDGPVNFAGRFYEAHGLVLRPPLDPELRPGVFLSGSSEAGRAAARALGATAVEYPQPGDAYLDSGPATGPGAGIRIGIVADPDPDRAWHLALERFPEDRKGQIAHRLAMQVSDSEWHRQLSELGRESAASIDPATGRPRSPYWLGPFENYRTFCPYLVGSDDEVATELARYIRAGFRVFILDIPAAREDLEMAGRVFRLALDKAAS
ncbi:MAG: LLM class flavin-dependent oxidoreductase [Acidobacteriota bacterium]